MFQKKLFFQHHFRRCGGRRFGVPQIGPRVRTARPAAAQCVAGVSNSASRMRASPKASTLSSKASRATA